jgi:DNA polymerase III subunit delta'
MSLQDIPGQARAKRLIQQMIRSGQVPHALLFSGLAGIGKAAAALELAKALNCQSVNGALSCDRCTSCQKIAGGLHPDLIWVKPDGAFIKLDQIRELRKRVQFRPFEGAWRIIVIASAEKLREESANALLKLLEEPPKQNVFILLVLEPQKLLSTILSRCCHIRFQPLDEGVIAARLMSVHGVPEERAGKIARMAQGSMERASCLADENELLRWREIISNIQHLDRLSMIELFDLTARWSKKSENLEQDFEYIKLWLRDNILSHLDHNYRPELEMNMDAQGLPSIPLESLFRLYDKVEEALHNLRGNANKQLVIEDICLAIREYKDGQGCRNPVSKGRQNLSF